jgi:hypothetical protein
MSINKQMNPRWTPSRRCRRVCLGCTQSVRESKWAFFTCCVKNWRVHLLLTLLFLLPFATIAQVSPEAAETEKVRRDLKQALESQFKQPELHALPKGLVLPGKTYRIEKSGDHVTFEGLFEEAKSGAAEAAPVRALPVMAPQAAVLAVGVSESSSATPPWVGLLLRRLDDIDSRVKRLETSGKSR